MESASPTEVLTVRAEDGDRGVDDQLRFEILDYDGSDDAKFFQINPTSGKITVSLDLKIWFDRIAHHYAVDELLFINFLHPIEANTQKHLSDYLSLVCSCPKEGLSAG